MQIWGKSIKKKRKEETEDNKIHYFSLYPKTVKLEDREVQTYSPRKLNLIFATLKQK